MRIRQTARKSSRAGYALILVLAVTTVCLIALGATIARTRSNAYLNDRNNEYTACLYAAEAATEKVLARMKYDFAAGNLTALTNNLGTAGGSTGYRSYYPTASEDPYWGNFQFTDGQGNQGTYVQCISSVGFGALQSQFTGLSGWTNTYRIVSNAKRLNSVNGVTAAVQQEVQFALIPVFQFAIFYNSLLEFTTCAPLTVNGRTHANSNIFVGSSSPLVFNSTVTTTGAITNPPWAGRTPPYTYTATYNGSPNYSTIANALALPIGTNTSYNTPDSVREIINMPPAGEDASSSMGQVRYFNEAKVVVLVSNSTVTVTLKKSATDITALTTNYNYTVTNNNVTLGTITNLPFVKLYTNGFYDQREGNTVKLTQIDVGKLNNWLLTSYATNIFPNNGGSYYSTNYVPNILYVADNRTFNSNTEMTAVRLTNGLVIPTNAVNWGIGSNLYQPSGFTVATPNPLYVLGSYNNPSGSTNTTGEFPASLVADAITVLSGAWNDSLSTGSYDNRNAQSTTVNAAILAGVVYSTGSAQAQFSGGAHNLTRLLEDWSGCTLTLNTSLVNLYNSVKATAQFQFPTAYYNVPSQRNFNFDLNFLDYKKLPPGTPTLPACIRQKWVVPPPNTINYAGN